MTLPIAWNNKKTKRDWFMVQLLMNSPHFSTHAPMRSGIPRIILSNVSAEKQHQSDREFSMRVTFDVAGFILSRTIAQRFSMGDRPGMLPFALKVGEDDLAPPLGLGSGMSKCFVLLKKGLRHVRQNFDRCAVGGMFSVLCLVADAAVLFSTYPRRRST